MKHQDVAPGRPTTTGLRGIVAAGAACLLLGACGSGTPSGRVTVTVTPTVTANGSSASASSSRPAAAAKPPTSDDKGRTYDFGAVVKASTVRGVHVLELDRFTWKGLDDAKLAVQGVPLKPFKGAVPYENVNTKLTYTLPVAGGAAILYHHCLAADQPLQTKSVQPSELVGLAERENTVLVRLDSNGWVVAADNVPGCPG
jgi:hypothetical protein